MRGHSAHCAKILIYNTDLSLKASRCPTVKAHKQKCLSNVTQSKKYLIITVIISPVLGLSCKYFS